MNMEAFNAHKDVQCTFLCALMYHHKSCQFHSMTLDDLDEYLYKVSFQPVGSLSSKRNVNISPSSPFFPLPQQRFGNHLELFGQLFSVYDCRRIFH